MSEPERRQPQIQLEVPDALAGGVYSNLVGVWHTAYEFTLDFAVMMPAQLDEHGTPTVPARVVARIKMPPAQIFELMQALSMNENKYEANFGRIHRPGQSEEPPLFPPES